MDLLISSGLFAGRLFPVDTANLVARYNACLTKIGQEPTGLTSFRIDAAGWSPEVAKEKGGIDYLSLGDVNRFAIILSPDQMGMPVYRPVHSFDRAAMEELFCVTKPEIADLTSRTGICVTLEHELTRLESPLDLLTVEWISMTSMDVAGLMPAAIEQRRLVTAFTEQESLWASKDFRAQIIKSAKDHGDLRFRSIIMPDFKFTDVRSYHSRAFGGTYVFRDIPKSDHVLVMEDEGQMSVSTKTTQVYSIGDPDLPEKLEDQGIVDIPFTWYRSSDGITALKELHSYLVVNAFYASNDERDWHAMSEAQRKQWLSSMQTKVDPLIFELERFISDLRRGTPIKNMKLSKELRTLLLRPSRAARESSEIVERVVWHLIARLSPHNLERLFVYNKLHFYALYSNWPLAKKQWAVKFLVDKGHPKLTTLVCKIKGKQPTK